MMTYTNEIPSTKLQARISFPWASFSLSSLSTSFRGISLNTPNPAEAGLMINETNKGIV